MVFFRRTHIMNKQLFIIKGKRMSSRPDVITCQPTVPPSEPAPVCLPKWVQAKLYATISGYTYAAIKNKCHQGVWPENVIWCKAPDGHLMINWRAADRWVESG